MTFVDLEILLPLLIEFKSSHLVTVSSSSGFSLSTTTILFFTFALLNSFKIAIGNVFRLHHSTFEIKEIKSERTIGKHYEQGSY